LGGKIYNHWSVYPNFIPKYRGFLKISHHLILSKSGIHWDGQVATDDVPRPTRLLRVFSLTDSG
jgi:hypothetical protein